MTARQPSPNAHFAAFLSRFPPEIVALVKKRLPKLRRAFLGAQQLVYGITFPDTRSTRMIIKSELKKRNRRRESGDQPV